MGASTHPTSASFLCASIPRATMSVPTQSMGTRCWVFASSCLRFFVPQSQEQLCPFPRRAWERGDGCLRLRVFVSLWFNPKSNYVRSHAEHGNEVLGVYVFVSLFLCGSIPRATMSVPTQSMGTRCWVFASSCLRFFVVQSQEQLFVIGYFVIRHLT